jgi:hypothetical protein
MARGISIKTLLGKTFKTFEFDGIWKEVLGVQERSGIWVIYASEKNYKTTFTLLLAEYLSKFERINFISAEEGTGFTFQENVARAKIDYKNSKIKFHNFLQLEEIEEILNNRQAARIMIFDNATAYIDDLKSADLRRLRRKYEKTLLIIVAHEERNEPSTAMSKLAKKLANVYIKLTGSVAFVAGRCPGGEIIIDEQKAKLYHGNQIKN